MFFDNFQPSIDGLIFRPAGTGPPLTCLSAEAVDQEADVVKVRRDEIKPAQWVDWAHSVRTYAVSPVQMTVEV